MEGANLAWKERFIRRTMTNIIKVQSESQIADVAGMANDIWREHYISIIGQDQVDYMLKEFQSKKAIARQLSEAYEYYIVVQDGEQVGYLGIVPDTNKTAMLISKIYVKKSVRSSGLGKKMMEFVENLCYQRGIQKIWLTVNKNNTDSIAWYLRMGFTNTGSIVQDIGGGFVMDDFRMEKAIA